MAWIKDSATRIGAVGNNDKGGYIVVRLRHEETGQIEELRYCKTATGANSATRFVAMVRQEAKAMLAHLNRATVGVDITAQIDLT